VDGSDYLNVASGVGGGTLTVQHRAYASIGEHSDCSDKVSTVNPATSLYDPTNGRFVIAGLPFSLSDPPVNLPIAGISSFTKNQGRGSVSLSAANQILLDDDGPGGAGVYVVTLCP
jgi:hypothetical protein